MAGILGVVDESAGDRFGGALLRGFRFAHELGHPCGPVHFLIGIAEGDGPAAAALTGLGRSLRQIVTVRPDSLGVGASYRHSQAQGAADVLVRQTGGPSAPEHLLIAILDQADPSVVAALDLAGIDPTAARTVALTGLGLPADLPSLTMPVATPAGTLGRPALPIHHLDPAAWSALEWRQNQLPVRRLRSRAAWDGLSAVEYRAVLRMADQRRLDDDQRYSLLAHHRAAIEDRMRTARPDLTPLTPEWHSGWLTTTHHGGFSRRRRRIFRFTTGWGTWFGNRRVGIRDRWFWLTTVRHYRHPPQP